MKTPSTVLLVVFVAAMGGGATAAQEPALETRLFDVSAITGWRTPRSAPELGPILNRDYERTSTLEERYWATLDDLHAFLEDMTPDEMWERDGFSLTTHHPATVAVTGPPEYVARVARWIAEIEAAATRRTTVAIQVYELPETAYAELAKGADPARMGEAALLRESGSTEAYDDATAMVEVANRVRYVADADVVIAQGAQLAGPVVAEAEEGLAADVLVRPTLGGEGVELSVLAQWGRFRRPFRVFELSLDEEYLPEKVRGEKRHAYGRIELPVFDEASVFVHRVVRSGEPWIVPVLRDGRLFAMRIVAAFANGAANAAAPISLTRLSTPGLNWSFGLLSGLDELERSRSAPRLESRGEGSGPLGGSESIQQITVHSVRPDLWGDSASMRLTNEKLFVSGPAGIREEVLAFLAAQEAALLRPLAVDVRVLSTGAAVRGEIGGIPEGSILHGVLLSTTNGRRAGALLGMRANYLHGYEVEAAQEARISDPVVGQEFGGFVVNVLPRLSADGATVHLEFDALVARLGQIRSLPSGAQTYGVVELPEVSRVVLSQSISMPANGTTVIDAGPDPAAEGRRLAIVVTTRLR